MMGGPHLEEPGTVFVLLGATFIAFRGKIAVGFNTLSEHIWNSERAKELDNRQWVLWSAAGLRRIFSLSSLRSLW